MSKIAPLLTTDDVLKALQIGDTTLRKLVKAGAFPAPIKVNNMNRWMPSDIDLFICSQRKPHNMPHNSNEIKNASQ